MNEEEQVTKKEWAMPHIFDLDVDRTKTGDVHPDEHSSAAGPAS